MEFSWSAAEPALSRPAYSSLHNAQAKFRSRNQHVTATARNICYLAFCRKSWGLLLWMGGQPPAASALRSPVH